MEEKILKDPLTLALFRLWRWKKKGERGIKKNLLN